jgi:small subunit ribosomal protein S17
LPREKKKADEVMAKSTTQNKTTSSAEKKIATRIGLVDSDQRSQTRRVVVERLSTHAKYGKIMRSRTILHVHDEGNESAFGDLVEVIACRPVSKTKRWKLNKVIQRGVGMRFEAVEAPKADDAPATAAGKAPAKAPAKAAPAGKAPAKAPAKK